MVTVVLVPAAVIVCSSKGSDGSVLGCRRFCVREAWPLSRVRR